MLVGSKIPGIEIKLPSFCFAWFAEAAGISITANGNATL
jgi:hypothetical protein